MKWIGVDRLVVVLVAAFVCGAGPAGAQTQQYGQRVGGTYLPSTHDPNCVGVICSPLPVDPANPTEVLQPPPCQGLLCALTPYSMQPPHSAAEAAAVAQQRAAAQAAAAAPPAPAPPTRHAHRHHKKVVHAAAAAVRTPVPAGPAQ